MSRFDVTVTEQTMREHMVDSREHAQRIYNDLISSGRKVAWFECGSVQDFLALDSTLSSAPPDSDVFVFLTMGKGFISWDLIDMAIPVAIQDTIFRLCPDDHLFHLARMGRSSG